MKETVLSGKWERRVHSFNYRGSIQELPWVYPVDQFRIILERECASVNRNCHTFSLIIFDIHDPDVQNSTTLRLVYALRTRMRSTDVLGVVEHDKLGVALPYCDVTGARNVAQDAISSLYNGEVAPRYEIFTYPTHWCYEEHVQTPSISAVRLRAEDSLQTLGPHINNPMPLWKRLLDIAGASAALILFSPVMLFTALLIKMVSRGPIFFRQERIGYLGQTFTFCKFRTMHAGSDVVQHQDYTTELIKNDNNGNGSKPMKKIENDCRLIPFGKAIRRACLDEFPQLYNVLKGDMSLVGPRPCLPYEAREYFLWNTERFNTMPGMTGLWQVNGKNELTFKEMIRLDITYTRNKSLWLDVRILLRTVPTIFKEIKTCFEKRAKRNTNTTSGVGECAR